jgi:hypothetical protein
MVINTPMKDNHSELHAIMYKLYCDVRRSVQQHLVNAVKEKVTNIGRQQHIPASMQDILAANVDEKEAAGW